MTLPPDTVGPVSGVDSFDEPGRYQADLVLGLTEPHEGDRYLDVGAGLGAMVHVIGPHVGATVGVDLAQPVLGPLRARAPALYPVAADAAALPFAAPAFTLATCDGVLHHTAEPGAVLAEAARVLLPGGRLLLLEPAGPEHPVLRQARDDIERTRAPDHVAILAPTRVRALLDEAGLELRAEERQTEDCRDDQWVALAGGDLDAVRGAIRRHRELAGGFRVLRWQDGGFLFRRERAYYLAVRP
ncbi:MAG: methyltransferase domain-containing protein [Actinomycetota bacterium]